MGSPTACWKLCFNMLGCGWKETSLLVRIPPAHVSRPAGRTVARRLLKNAAHPSADAERCGLFTHPAVAGQQFNSFGGKSQ